jgi:two-component system response regulator YesN
MLYSAAEKLNLSVNDMFKERDKLEISLNAYKTLEEMYALIDYATEYFEKAIKTEMDEKKQIKRVIQFIHNNMDKDIRREDIAEAVYLNPDYLSRLFKREVGVSLKEFILTNKMKEAQALLRSTPQPVSVVALKVGYTHFAHFSQVYKKIMGVTPSEERDGKDQAMSEI